MLRRTFRMAMQNRPGPQGGVGPGTIPYARFPEHAQRMWREEDQRLREAAEIGERYAEEQRRQMQQQQQEDSESSPRQERMPNRARDKYSSGTHQNEKWFNIFGSRNAVPMKGAHPDFKKPSMKLREVEQDEDQLGMDNNNNHDLDHPHMDFFSQHSTMAAAGGGVVSRDGVSRFQQQQMREAERQREEELRQQQQREQQMNRSGMQYFRAAKRGDLTEDPFLAAFAPNSVRAGKGKQSGAEQGQQQQEKQQQANSQTKEEGEKSVVPVTATEPMKTPQENDASTTSAAGTTTTTTTGGGGTTATVMAPSADPYSRQQVGGASLGEWRAKIKRLRDRGEGNLVVRLQGEIGFAHILAQTGRSEDAEECLQVGEYVWKKLDELRHASPDSEGSTHGIIINVCSAMRRAARTAGKSEVATMWDERLTKSSRQIQENWGMVAKSKTLPQDQEPGKQGPRKFKIDANALWSNLRNPWMDLAWAKKVVPPNPNDGPRY